MELELDASDLNSTKKSVAYYYNLLFAGKLEGKLLSIGIIEEFRLHISLNNDIILITNRSSEIYLFRPTNIFLFSSFRFVPLECVPGLRPVIVYLNGSNRQRHIIDHCRQQFSIYRRKVLKVAEYVQY